MSTKIIVVFLLLLNFIIPINLMKTDENKSVPIVFGGESSQMKETGVRKEKGNMTRIIVAQQIELINFYLWIDLDVLYAINLRNVPESERPPIKEEAKEAIRFLARYNVRPQQIERKIFITHQEMLEIIPDQGSQPGNVSKLSENEMNELREKMIDEFEHRQMEKYGNFIKFYVKIIWDYAENEEQMKSFRFKLALGYKINDREHVEHTWTEYNDVAMFRLPKAYESQAVNYEDIPMRLDVWKRNDDVYETESKSESFNFISKEFVQFRVLPENRGNIINQFELKMLYPEYIFLFEFVNIRKHRRVVEMKCGGRKKWAGDGLPATIGQVKYENNLPSKASVEYTGHACPEDKYQVIFSGSGHEILHEITCSLSSTAKTGQILVYSIDFKKKLECIFKEDLNKGKEIVNVENSDEDDQHSGDKGLKTDAKTQIIQKINLTDVFQEKMTDFYFWMDKETKLAIEERKRYKKNEKPPMKKEVKEAICILARNNISRSYMKTKFRVGFEILQKTLEKSNIKINPSERIMPVELSEERADEMREKLIQDFEEIEMKKLGSADFHKFYVKIVWPFLGHAQMKSFRFKLALNYEIDGNAHVHHAWTEHYDMAMFKLPKCYGQSKSVIDYQQISMFLNIWYRDDDPNQTKFISVFVFDANKFIQVTVQSGGISTQNLSLNSLYPIFKFKFTFLNFGVRNFLSGMKCGTKYWAGDEFPVQIRNRNEALVEYTGQPCPMDKYQVKLKNVDGETEILHGIICEETSKERNDGKLEIKYTIDFNLDPLKCKLTENVIVDAKNKRDEKDEQHGIDQETAAKRRKLIIDLNDSESG